jgi:putative oxidoreductase
MAKAKDYRSKKMTNRMVTRLIIAALILLFVYTAVVKWSDMDVFKKELANQTIPGWSVPWLAWLIPLLETLIVIMLLIPASRLWGLWISTMLLTMFTGYMGLVVLNVFDRVPCSCGGVLKSMDFPAHFVFNLFFLSLSLIATWLTYQSKRELNIPQ